MKEALYLDDSYLKEFDAEVVNVKDDKFVVLNQTAFYPNGGGQPFDEGTISKDGEDFKVVFVGKFDGKISHEVDHPGLKEGDKVHCKLDWEKRYALMRNHTAAHILSGVISKEAGALITGNQLGVDKSRVDFNLENMDREKIEEYIQKTNNIIKEGREIKICTLPREEAEKIPDVFKLAKAMPNLKEFRIVEIADFDMQADGGTHVKNTSEVGEIEMIKIDNKGKNNRRIYFKLK